MSDKYVSSHLEMKYFVLKPRGNNIYAKASRNAMLKYAEIIGDAAPKFADELGNWVAKCAKEAIEDEQ